ncbi:pogo transposable element with KRAB domain-like [Rhizophagus irregularis DAOM 181602=DAOM 197198]|nr:pogo transposable element with KRAB domain-like [Rhizophagus irregularis DAOM 181602=DAOM 197198]
MAGNMNINNKGDKTVHICTTGNDKNQFTVVLTCSADSSKYPPICIFKEKQLSRNEVISKGIISVIPAGLTSICQPLDVSINKPFKDNMRKEWHIWMCQIKLRISRAGL